MKRFKLELFIALLILLVFASCGKKEAPVEITPPPAVTAVPTPAPTPEPTPEPVYEPSSQVTVEGTKLDSGSVLIDGVRCVRKEELAAALGREPEGDAYIPIEAFCDENHIGMLYDEEYDHLYCTVAAGDWELKPGYNVPVLMYHEVLPEEMGGDGDTVRLADFEEQLKWLTENGYSLIWFEDLAHVEDYEKPVIFTFDDGYVGNYEYLLPLLKKYDAKATVCVFVDPIYHVADYLTKDQIVELSQSGYVSIQSHTINHPYLNQIGKDMQEFEVMQSRLEITRLTGKEPIVLAYPYGDTTDYVMELVREHYRFGLKMVGFRSYNTSDDPAVVWRFWPSRSTGIEEYKSWFTMTFGE